MRVVAGSAGGRRLAGPPGTSTRPTSDRVREATFNALASLGAIEGAVVLDLFAGSGALGIEALSRGASRATFVDHDPRALAVVRANLATTGLAGAATVVRSDALRFVTAAPAASFDLALLDPPYRFDDPSWIELLARVGAPLAVVESDRSVDPGPGWRTLRTRRYGGTVVLLAQRDDPGRQQA
ncbi:MAG: 16S rRNA (guanine(966)-N(2))-methyltransferase RsmD [Actinomycetota bacterium]|nr:16S rRNA (guanine(966)-N(2))-methyltransferase RsmD [Actinomycetota bacterium]